MLLYAVVGSGQLVSGTVDLRQLALKLIMVPAGVISGDLAVQGNVDSTSGNFLRTLDFRGQGSGDLRFPTGLGSRMVLWPETIPTPPFARLETLGAPGSLQTDNRTFVLLAQPRR
jgi:hypothetical protein